MKKRQSITEMCREDKKLRNQVIRLMRRFKRDTELFTNTKFSRPLKSKLTYHELEEKWINDNI